MVQIGQTDEDIRRQIAEALLIAEILGLLHAQIIRHEFLGVIVIFPKLPQTFIVCQYTHPAITDWILTI